MTAGLNLKLKIWRFQFIEDDEVGGAQPSGTVLYEHVSARKAMNLPGVLMSEQGYETDKTSKYIAYPATLLVKERDEIQISNPSSHVDCNKFFRVIGVERMSFHPKDRRGYLMISTDRSETAHRNM